MDIPIHENDIFLLLGDLIWVCWNIYGLLTGVPLTWGLISLIASLFSSVLILAKYYDPDWIKEI